MKKKLFVRFNDYAKENISYLGWVSSNKIPLNGTYEATYNQELGLYSVIFRLDFTQFVDKSRLEELRPVEDLDLERWM